VQSKLDVSTKGVVGDLISSGQLDLSGDTVEWKGTTWEAFILACKHKMDYADESVSVVEGSDGVLTSITEMRAINETSENESAVTADVEIVLTSKSKSNSTPHDREYSTASSPTAAVTVTVPAGVAAREEYEIQLGFAYWTLGNALWVRGKGDESMKWSEKEGLSEAVSKTAATAATRAEVRAKTVVDDYGEGSKEMLQQAMNRIRPEVGVDKIYTPGAKVEDEVEVAMVKEPGFEINCVATLEEAERVLKLATSYFDGKALATGAVGVLIKNLADRLQEVVDEKCRMKNLSD
jgi:hypothetical protein